MNKIIVEKMADGWKAYRQDEHGHWGFGGSEYAAIGNLVNAHRDVFGVEIEFSDEVKIEFSDERPVCTLTEAQTEAVA